jgi:signal peptidase I
MIASPTASDPTRVHELPWRSVMRISLARAILTTLASLLVWSVLPAALGWSPRVIMSGSMEPRIDVGDVIVTRTVPAATLGPGQVITVKDPDHPRRTRTHRLVDRATDGTLVLKGDANPQPDSSHVPVADVLGLAVIRVPFVGRPAYWFARRDFADLAGLGAALGWCVVTAFPPGSRRRRNTGSGPRAPERPRRGRQRITKVAATLAILTISAAGPAGAAFTQPATNAGNKLNAAITFYPYKSAVTADTPSFYWRLNETSGTTVADSGSSARPGTITGTGFARAQTGALPTEARDTSTSLTQSAITANTTVAGPTTFSIEAWIKTATTTGGRIIGWGDQGGSTTSTATQVDRQLYVAPTGKVYFGIGTLKTVIASNAALNNNAWHHIVGTYTTGTNGMKLYVDNTLQGSATATTITTANGFWRAGAETMSGWTGNPDTYYDGLIDEVAVYPTALTAARVTAHYNAGTTP